MSKLKQEENKAPRRKGRQPKAQVKPPTKTSTVTQASAGNGDEETILIPVVPDPTDPDVVMTVIFVLVVYKYGRMRKV